MQKKLRKLIEAINSYYSFAVLLYAAALYAASHSRLFLWVLAGTTPLLAGWTGYLLNSYLQSRNYRQGFKIVSDVMTYEINSKHRSTLRYSTELKAGANHLVVYPIGYQWTGDGEESVPQITKPGQQLLATTERLDRKNTSANLAPYNLTGSTEGEWHYWFVAFNPPVHMGDTVHIRYQQEFNDKAGTSKPVLYYTVRVPMKRLELNVKFPAGALPKNVTCSFIKPSDPSRPRKSSGVKYDPDKQWATWVIDKPKKGYCYRIQW